MSDDFNPAEQLYMATLRVAQSTKTERLAAFAYGQAVCAQAALDGLIKLLLQQNIVSKEKIAKVIDDAYMERFRQLSGENSAPQTPVARVQ